jgi:uncharacterized repeat protein (TIGR03943 family)
MFSMAATPPLWQRLKVLQIYLDVVAIGLVGALLVSYWLTGKLNLLLHPNYHGLTLVAGALLLSLAVWRGWELWERRKSARVQSTGQHLALLPSGWGSWILIAVALLGFWITPKAFTSQTALQRGVTDVLANTQVKPQAFKGATNSADRNLIEWIRMLQLYPEPEAYAGQAVKVQGFAVHPEKLPGQYFLLTRFTITCCAADASPVSLPVKLRQGDRASYKPDQWFEVAGKMMVETLAQGDRQLVIDAVEIRPIEQPANPYNY